VQQGSCTAAEWAHLDVECGSVLASLVQTLGTKCHKDANVNVVMEAAKLLEGLAKGLGKSFGQFRGVTMTGLMERLKERKAAVSWRHWARHWMPSFLTVSYGYRLN
jgi:hypothetical protein